MAIPIIMLVLPLIISSTLTSSSSDKLSQGSSLSVENTNDILTSPNGIFSAGFFPVGNNAYCFAIWFNEPFCVENCTIVWMANRDEPVNGKKSEFSLLRSGNLIITDAGRFTIWDAKIVSKASVNLFLNDRGNLVLQNKGGDIVWQSFGSPTDTLLPQQLLTKDTRLVSSRSKGNYSSGFYQLYFDDDNVLRMLYKGPEISVYWPDPELMSWESGRSMFNSSRIAFLGSLGNFSSSDGFSFMSADYGSRVQRRLKLDFDGNMRLYSREDGSNKWVVSWQAMSQSCRIHGTCGPNSLCNYVPNSGRKCSCIPGYKTKDPTDWSLGCEPEFNLSCNKSEIDFLKLTNVEFFGYDYGFFPNYTLEMCKNLCSQICDCKGFQFKFIKHNYPSNIPYCYPKTLLLNGHHSSNFEGDIYLKVPNTSLILPGPVNEIRLDCSVGVVKQLNRTYPRSHQNASINFVLRFAIGVGVIEFLGISLVWFFLIRTRNNSTTAMQGYHCITSGFRKFTYAELRKAARGFREEIGRGAGGVVYKGLLSDHRVAAIKKLNVANYQGEAEFRAEVTTIGKLNHINLIEMWGYCTEGKHRLLVYKYMEHGSLAESLSSDALDWQKRYDIAVGTAKGLAYLHEECLEWVLHCDVKPQNILLDCNYNPKVSDFGLSRQLKRGNLKNSGFSKIRGTRGYMAPEWVFNFPITSKVDVYSYGMVVLEMVTGKSPTEEMEHRTLLKWMRDLKNGVAASDSWIEQIIDPKLEGKYDQGKMEVLARVALKCVNEDKDARPSMSQVVEMLTHHNTGLEYV